MSLLVWSILEQISTFLFFLYKLCTSDNFVPVIFPCPAKCISMISWLLQCSLSNLDASGRSPPRCQTPGSSSTAASFLRCMPMEFRTGQAPPALSSKHPPRLQQPVASRLPATAVLLGGEVGSYLSSPVAAKETAYTGCTENPHFPTATTTSA